MSERFKLYFMSLIGIISESFKLYFMPLIDELYRKF